MRNFQPGSFNRLRRLVGEADGFDGKTFRSENSNPTSLTITVMSHNVITMDHYFSIINGSIKPCFI